MSELVITSDPASPRAPVAAEAMQGESPLKIELKKRSGVLAIHWRDGVTDSIASSELRRFCACSGCRARQHVGWQMISDSSDIADLVLMGGNGMQIVFSDGHDRGVYPWPYLRAIAAGRAREYLNG